MADNCYDSMSIPNNECGVYGINTVAYVLRKYGVSSGEYYRLQRDLILNYVSLGAAYLFLAGQPIPWWQDRSALLKWFEEDLTYGSMEGQAPDLLRFGLSAQGTWQFLTNHIVTSQADRDLLPAIFFALMKHHWARPAYTAVTRKALDEYDRIVGPTPTGP